MIVIADAGPILHLYWVGAMTWAFPFRQVDVVEEVWQEVWRHAPAALADRRFRRREVTPPYPPELSSWNLDAGELAALSHAIRQRHADDVLVLCDEHEARNVCLHLAIPVVGSIGLIVRACQAGRVSKEMAQTTLRDLPYHGRLHVRPELIELAVNMLSSS